jgi:hypothetical protein
MVESACSTSRCTAGSTCYVLPQGGVGDPDALPRETAVQFREVVGDRHAAAGGIARILPGNAPEERRAVADRARQRSEMIG